MIFSGSFFSGSFGKRKILRRKVLQRIFWFVEGLSFHRKYCPKRELLQICFFFIKKVLRKVWLVSKKCFFFFEWGSFWEESVWNKLSGCCSPKKKVEFLPEKDFFWLKKGIFSSEFSFFKKVFVKVFFSRKKLLKGSDFFKSFCKQMFERIFFFCYRFLNQVIFSYKEGFSKNIYNFLEFFQK